MLKHFQLIKQSFSYNQFTRYYCSSSSIISNLINKANNGDIDSQYKLAIEYNKLENKDKSIFWLNEAANKNHIKAQNELGLLLINNQDYKNAFHWFEKAAENNYINAQYNLGLMYENGYYIERDLEKAKYYYKLTADKGFVLAQCNLGLLYLEEAKKENKNIKEALYYLDLASKQDNTIAHYNIGDIYRYVLQKMDKAIEYYLLAAKHNHSKSLLALAEIYWNGKSIPKDEEKALKYCKQASENGLIEATLLYVKIITSNDSIDNMKEAISLLESMLINNNNELQDNYKEIINLELAKLYINSSRNIKRGLLLLKKISNMNSNYELGNIYKQGKYVKKDLELAYKYYKMSAYQGSPNALFECANCLYNGIGIDKDIDEAVILYKKAASLGNSSAIYTLSILPNKLKINFDSKDWLVMAQSGIALAQVKMGTFALQNRRDNNSIPINALKWFKLAADQNDPEGLYYLGFCFEYGIDTKVNISTAFRYYNIAASLSHPSSTYNVGRMYSSGLGIKKDVNKGFQYIKRAAELGHAKAKAIVEVYGNTNPNFQKKE